MEKVKSSDKNIKQYDSAYTYSCSYHKSTCSSKSGLSETTSSKSSGYNGKPPTAEFSKRSAKAVKEENPVNEPVVVKVETKSEEVEKNDDIQITEITTPPENIGNVSTTPKTTIGEVESKMEKMEVATSSLRESDDNGFFCVISMDDGVVLYATESISTSLGFPADMWIGKPFVDFLHPDDRNAFASHVSDAVKFWKNINTDVENPVSTVLYRLRPCQLMNSRFIRSRVVTYVPFYLKFFFKNIGEDDLVYMIIQAITFGSAYKMPNEKITNPLPFVIKHSTNGCLKFIDPRSVSYLGYLPQDLIDKDTLFLYHPHDLDYLYAVYETIVKNEKVERGKSYRMRAQNGHYVKVETEWCALKNPWSGNLEYIVGKHYVIEGPTNPNVFDAPEVDYQIISETKNRKYQTVRNNIKILLNKALSTPKPKTNDQDMRFQDIADFMESFIDKVSNSKHTIEEHDTLNMFNTNFGSLLQYENNKNHAQSSSYIQLNYDDTLQRYFNTYCQVECSDDVPRSLLQTNIKKSQRPAFAASVDKVTAIIESLAATNPGCSSNATNPGCSNNATNPGFSSNATNPGCSSNATNAGCNNNATNPGFSSNATNPGYSSNATNAGCSSNATNAGCSNNATNPGCSSNATNAVCSNNATNPGFSSNATNAGCSNNATNPGFSNNATNAGCSNNATNQGFSSNATNAGCSNNATNQGFSSNATNPGGSSNATNAGCSSNATNAGCSNNATNPGFSSNATNAGCSNNATNPGFSNNATNAGCSNNATNQGFSSNATNAGCSNNATNQGFSSNATNPGGSSNATNAGCSSNATNAGCSNNATNPGFSSNATNAGCSNNATNPGFSSNATNLGFSNNATNPGFSSNAMNAGCSNNATNRGFNNATNPGFSSNFTIPGYSSNARNPGCSSNATIPGYSSNATIPGYGSNATIPGYSSNFNQNSDVCMTDTSLNKPNETQGSEFVNTFESADNDIDNDAPLQIDENFARSDSPLEPASAGLSDMTMIQPPNTDQDKTKLRSFDGKSYNTDGKSTFSSFYSSTYRPILGITGQSASADVNRGQSKDTRKKVPENKKSNEQIMSYVQMNYNDTLERYFNTNGRVESAENDPRCLLQPNVNMPTTSSPFSSNVWLTETLLNKHNKKMEKEFVNIYKSKPRDLVDMDASSKQIEEHLARCNATFEPTSAGLYDKETSYVNTQLGSTSQHKNKKRRNTEQSRNYVQLYDTLQRSMFAANVDKVAAIIENSLAASCPGPSNNFNQNLGVCLLETSLNKPVERIGQEFVNIYRRTDNGVHMGASQQIHEHIARRNSSFESTTAGFSDMTLFQRLNKDQNKTKQPSADRKSNNTDGKSSFSSFYSSTYRPIVGSAGQSASANVNRGQSKDTRSTHISHDSKNINEHLSSYVQLNYNDTLQRYFNTDGRVYYTNNVPRCLLQSNVDITSTRSFFFANVDKVSATIEKSLLASSPCSNRNLNPGSNMNLNPGSNMNLNPGSNRNLNQNSNVWLSQTLLNKHNEKMEQEFVNVYKIKENDIHMNASQQIKEHLVRCNATFQPTSACLSDKKPSYMNSKLGSTSEYDNKKRRNSEKSSNYVRLNYSDTLQSSPFSSNVWLTETLLNKHNKKMEQEFLNVHKSKDNDIDMDASSKQIEEHLARCNATFEPTSAGLSDKETNYLRTNLESTPQHENKKRKSSEESNDYAHITYNDTLQRSAFDANVNEIAAMMDKSFAAPNLGSSRILNQNSNFYPPTSLNKHNEKLRQEFVNIYKTDNDIDKETSQQIKDYIARCNSSLEPTTNGLPNMETRNKLRHDSNQSNEQLSFVQLNYNDTLQRSPLCSDVWLTETLLNKHNKKMEQEFLNVYKSKDNDVEMNSSQKIEEHLARCNASYEPTSAGLSDMETNYLKTNLESTPQHENKKRKSSEESNDYAQYNYNNTLQSPSFYENVNKVAAMIEKSLAASSPCSSRNFNQNSDYCSRETSFNKHNEKLEDEFVNIYKRKHNDVDKETSQKINEYIARYNSSFESTSNGLPDRTNGLKRNVKQMYNELPRKIKRKTRRKRSLDRWSNRRKQSVNTVPGLQFKAPVAYSTVSGVPYTMEPSFKVNSEKRDLTDLEEYGRTRYHILKQEPTKTKLQNIGGMSSITGGKSSLSSFYSSTFKTDFGSAWGSEPINVDGGLSKGTYLNTNLEGTSQPENKKRKNSDESCDNMDN